MTTPWISFPCPTTSARWRYQDDGKVEVEGMGVPMPKSWPARVNRWTSRISTYASRYGLPEHMVAGIMALESGGDEGAGSPAGAQGLMQLMPSTASAQASAVGMGFSNSLIKDPDTNIELGTAYLRRQIDRYGDFIVASVAYNAGKIYCGPSCKQGSYWGVCTDGSAYPLLAAQYSNAALDNGFGLSAPLPDMTNLPPVVLPSRPFIRDLNPLTAALLTAMAAYGAYVATNKSLQKSRRLRRLFA